MAIVRRSLFALAFALSLVPCAATAVLWVNSYHRGRIAFWTRPRSELQCGTSRGNLWVYWASEPPAVAARRGVSLHVESYSLTMDPRNWGYGPREVPFLFDRGGFALASGPYATVPGRQAGVVIVPCWSATLLALVPPLGLAYHWRRRRRRRARADAGLCRH